MADETPESKLAETGLGKLKRCRRWKALWSMDLREAYFFAAPQRNRMMESTSMPTQSRIQDAGELNTDLAFELCGDFATEVLNTYMSQETPWCERGAGMYMPDDQFDQIKDQVREDDKTIFKSMKASNLYPELSKAFDPDLSIGTVGLWVEPPRPGEAVIVTAVPIREMEIDLGPYGEIDTRFVVRYTTNEYVQELVGAEVWDKVSDKVKKDIADKPLERTEVRWGFWRKWDRHDDEVWQAVVYVADVLVHDYECVGDGSCPFIVFRWNPNPDWPWGHGPLLQYLPSLRQVDELELTRAEHAEMAIWPPMGFPDDSFAAIEQGLEPRMAYPIRPGTQDAIKPIYQVQPPNEENYEYAEKEKRLRRGFFVDFPVQSGDTPPTLGQWLDELARAQRRIGRPGLPFWREGPAKIFLRFKWILERRGVIAALQVNGAAVSLQPYNPTQRAAEQQEIAMAVHALQIMAQFFPEEFKAVVDGQATMKAFLDKMRVELVAFRDPKTVQNAVNMIGKLVGGAPPGGAGAPVNPMTAAAA